MEVFVSRPRRNSAMMNPDAVLTAQAALGGSSPQGGSPADQRAEQKTPSPSGSFLKRGLSGGMRKR